MDGVTTISVHQYYFSRSWTSFVIAGADILEHQKIATNRTDKSDFSHPALSKLFLDGEVVLVIHLILSIWIHKKNETAAGWGRENGTGCRHGKRRRWNSVIERIPCLEHRRTTTRVGNRRASITRGAGP